MATKTKKSIAQRVAGGDRKLLKRALANPGLRSKLPTQYLSPAQRQQRQVNTRLRQPITPGSTTTERDLAREAQAATQVEYGPQEADLRQRLGVARQRATDVGGFYDQYLSELQHNQANVQAAGQQATGQLAGTAAGVTGLSAANLTDLQNPAVADARARGATAGDLSQMASNATATRQALMGSFQAQQALQSAAANRYSGGLAHVVGPGQKLQAQAQAQGAVGDVRELQSDLVAKRAAADQLYRSTQRSSEAKQVLANKIAGVNADTKVATLAEKVRSDKAGEGLAGARLTSQEQQTKARLEQQAREGRLNRANRLKLQGLRDKDKKSKPGKSSLMPSGQAGPWYTQLTTARDLAVRAKEGRKFDEPAGQEGQKDPDAALDRHAAAMKVLQYGGSKLKDPVLASAGADAAYLGFLSANTVTQLRKAGLSAQRASELLGVPTWREYKRRHPGGSGRPDTAGNPNVSS